MVDVRVNVMRFRWPSWVIIRLLLLLMLLRLIIMLKFQVDLLRMVRFTKLRWETWLLRLLLMLSTTLDMNRRLSCVKVVICKCVRCKARIGNFMILIVGGLWFQWHLLLIPLVLGWLAWHLAHYVLLPHIFSCLFTLNDGFSDEKGVVGTNPDPTLPLNQTHSSIDLLLLEALQILRQQHRVNIDILPE